MDNLTKEQRQKNMSKIRSKNTTPEKILMRKLKQAGVYFTKHCKDVMGKPDIVFKRKKTAIFIDSDFWHGKANIPKSNQEYWVKKLERNRQRDIEVNCFLKEAGWTVIRFTEKQIKKEITMCLEIIFATIGRERKEEPAE